MTRPHSVAHFLW